MDVTVCPYPVTFKSLTLGSETVCIRNSAKYA